MVSNVGYGRQCLFHLSGHASEPPHDRQGVQTAGLHGTYFSRKNLPHSLVIKNPPGQQLEKTLHFLQVGAVSAGIPPPALRGSEGFAGSVGEKIEGEGGKSKFLPEPHYVCLACDLPLCTASVGNYFTEFRGL